MLKLKRTAMITALFPTFLLMSLPNALAKTQVHEPSKKTATKAIAKDRAIEAWDKIRPEMLTISRQLGVTCIYCHDSKNYRDSSKRAHKIAKAHLEMVDMINERFKDSFSDKIDCYSCHKGVAKPEFKEKKEKF